MDPPESRIEFTPWELAQVRMVLRRYSRLPRDDLEAHLLAKLLQLKRHAAHIRYWKSYCASSLRHEAANVARQWTRQRTRDVTPSQIADPPDSEALFGAARLPDPDLPIAMQAVWSRLSPERRHFWRVLAEEEGHFGRTAKRLGKHRNTIRLWAEEIRALLQEAGLS